MDDGADDDEGADDDARTRETLERAVRALTEALGLDATHRFTELREAYLARHRARALCHNLIKPCSTNAMQRAASGTCQGWHATIKI